MGGYVDNTRRYNKSSQWKIVILSEVCSYKLEYRILLLLNKRVSNAIIYAINFVCLSRPEKKNQYKRTFSTVLYLLFFFHTQEIIINNKLRSFKTSQRM